jgi:hypothetical protein
LKLLASYLITFISFATFGQTCDCEKEFTYIQKIIEQNYAGFPDKITEISKKKYVKTTNELKQISKRKFDNADCIYIIKNYLDQFRDKHIQFGFTPDTSLRNNFPLQLQTYRIPDRQIKRLKKSRGIEGLYYLRSDSTFKIAVIEEKTAVHDYIAVILTSKDPELKPGQIRWEGKLISDTVLMVIRYRPYSFGFDGLHIRVDRLGHDWIREGSQKHTVPPRTEATLYEVAQKLTDNTFYLRIPSFDPKYAREIDSIISYHHNVISRTANLIIDLRRNGGGSDFSYSPLVKYIYTGPFKTIGVDVWASELNIEGWKDVSKNKDIPEEQRKWIQERVTLMENNKGKLVNISPDSIDSSFSPMPYPKKVGILMDRASASTTEQFLLMAKQSKKVILLGENSQGTLDYSNMRSIPFSCFPYVLYYATTRSRRIDVGQGIDNDGIKPNHYLKKDSDWVQEAIKILGK